MKKGLILLGVLVFTLTPVFSNENEWEKVCANTYVKKDTLKKKFFRKSKVLVRFYNDGKFQKVDGKYVKYSDNYMHTTCNKDNKLNYIALKYVENYDNKAELINRHDVKQFNKRYLPFSPKSKGHYINRYVCEITRGPKKSSNKKEGK